MQGECSRSLPQPTHRPAQGCLPSPVRERRTDTPPSPTSSTELLLKLRSMAPATLPAARKDPAGLKVMVADLSIRLIGVITTTFRPGPMPVPIRFCEGGWGRRALIPCPAPAARAPPFHRRLDAPVSPSHARPEVRFPPRSHPRSPGTPIWLQTRAGMGMAGNTATHRIRLPVAEV